MANQWLVNLIEYNFLRFVVVEVVVRVDDVVVGVAVAPVPVDT